MSQTDKLLQEISGKMDKLLRLQALEVVKGIAAEQGKIELLDSLGFRPIEIAQLLNKTPDNIGVQLSIIRKKKAGKKAKPADQTQTSETSRKESEVAVTSKIEGNEK
jgi:hypothetical protein